MRTMPTSPSGTGCLGRVLRIAAAVLAILGLALGGLLISQRLAVRRLRDRYSPPGQIIEVGSHKMHLHCVGSGSPTVVVDAGNGSFSLEWMPVQEALQTTTRVCVYDRAGYGWSEPGPAPRDGAQAVTELHTLLEAAGEPGPFVLVGHSLGGIHARIYAARYPDQVAGLVLVDTAAEYVVSAELEQQIRSSVGFYRVMRLLTGSGLLRVLGPLGGEGTMPEAARKMPERIRDAYLEMVLDPQQHTTAIAEMEQLPNTLRQAGEAVAGERPLGDRPLIVLTAGQRPAPGSNPFEERRVAADEAVIARQGALARLSLRGEQRVVDDSGHLMHLDAPDALVTAVIDAVQMAR